MPNYHFLSVPKGKSIQLTKSSGLNPKNDLGLIAVSTVFTDDNKVRVQLNAIGFDDVRALRPDTYPNLLDDFALLSTPVGQSFHAVNVKLELVEKDEISRKIGNALVEFSNINPTNLLQGIPNLIPSPAVLAVDITYQAMNLIGRILKLNQDDVLGTYKKAFDDETLLSLYNPSRPVVHPKIAFNVDYAEIEPARLANLDHAYGLKEIIEFNLGNEMPNLVFGTDDTDGTFLASLDSALPSNS